MRATERLLEEIADEATAIVESADQAARHAAKIVEAALELRRRGDTLISREDLRMILRHVDPLGADAALASTLERLERTLGG
jgi:hypothetical protein